MALQNDPLSLEVQREIGLVQIGAGRYQEAITMLQSVRAVDPNFPYADTFLARALVFAGRPVDALHVYKGMGLGRPRQMVLAYAALGMRAEAEALAAEHMDAPPSMLATIYAALGDKDRAVDALNQTALVEPQRLPLVLTFPEIAVLLRGDPRLASFRQRFRLPPQ